MNLFTKFVLFVSYHHHYNLYVNGTKKKQKKRKKKVLTFKKNRKTFEHV